MNAFARVTAGLEHIAWQDIQTQTGAALRGFGHRRIDLWHSNAQQLLALNSVDDVYLEVAHLYGLDHTRPSLAALQQAAQADWHSALSVISQLRPLPASPTYGITASFVGKRNYSRYDIENALHTYLVAQLPMRFVPNGPSSDDTLRDVEVRVLLEADWARIGIRLGHAPLHRRPYKTDSLPGSLKAPVAYNLCQMAELGPSDAVLDITCGAGTILIEAALHHTSGPVAGIDLAPQAAQAAHHNAVRAGLSVAQANTPTDLRPAQQAARITLCTGDAQHLHALPQRFQAVISNLPWGRQVAAGTDLLPLYAGLLDTVQHSLSAGGRAVLLTDQTAALDQALRSHPQLALITTTTLSLFGSHPVVYQLQKQP